MDALPHTCWITIGEVVLDLLFVCGFALLDTLLEVVSGSAVAFFAFVP